MSAAKGMHPRKRLLAYGGDRSKLTPRQRRRGAQKERRYVKTHPVGEP